MNYKITDSELLNGFQYSDAYEKLLELNLMDFDFWYFFEEKRAVTRLKGLRNRYPDRNIIPFATRDDNDDIACFDKDDPNIVYIIHDFASAGYELRKTYSSLWDWFQDVINELILENREAE